MQKKTSRPNKALFVLEHFHPYIGGAEKLFLALTKSLAESGTEVIVITTRFDRSLPKIETFNGIRIVRVACWNRYLFTFLSLPKIFKAAARADFIHTTTYNAALPSILIGLLKSKKVFVTFHEVWGKLWFDLPDISWISSRLFYLYESLLLKLPFTKFIAVSNFTKSELLKSGVESQKVVRIYNGLDYSKYNSLSHEPTDNFTFTYFGRVGISKGLDILVPAAIDFLKLHSGAIFKLIISVRPQKKVQEIKRLIKRHQLENQIKIFHNLSEQSLYREISTSSCVVIPSYSEGFCFAATEAVAIGVPIISSGQGALTETVSGKYLTLQSQDKEGMIYALQQAYNEEWKKTEIKKFYLSDSEENYHKFYLDNSQ